MNKNDFEAYAYTWFDWNNDDYKEDYPHRIVAHVNGKIETWKHKNVCGLLRYYLDSSEPYTLEKWLELANDDVNEAMDDLTREDFEHYTASGLVFG